MNTKSFFIACMGLLFLVAVLLEGSVTTMPLVLIFLLSFAIIKQNEAVFILALLSGVLLDLMTLRPVGETSLFYVFFLFGILLYDRKYEIHSLPFVIAASFLGSALYLMVFARQSIFPASLVAACLAVFLFAAYRLFHRGETRKSSPYSQI